MWLKNKFEDQIGLFRLGYKKKKKKMKEKWGRPTAYKCLHNLY